MKRDQTHDRLADRPRGQVFANWFMAQESLLHKQAQLAGLLGQSSTVGTAREFVIKRILRTILPPLVHIGSGMVIDAFGNPSRQIDIVLYDPRFPVMEFDEGIGLYPIEGVICTLEIKSNLKGAEFDNALDNCHSVHQLRSAAPPQDALRKKAEAFCKELPDMPMREALIKSGCEFYPATYIMAFRGVTAQTIQRKVTSWYKSKKHPIIKLQQGDKKLAGVVPVLPRIIVSGTHIGAARDGWFRNSLRDRPAGQLRDKQDGRIRRVMMITRSTKFPLWWLASHILHTTSNRLGMTHGTMGIRYRIDHHIEPPSELINGRVFEIRSSIQDYC